MIFLPISLSLSDFSQDKAAQRRDNVLPVPVGLSSKAFSLFSNASMVLLM